MVEKAKKTVRQKEAVQEQGRELNNERKRGESLEELEKTIAGLQVSMDEFRRKPRDSGFRGRRGGLWSQRQGGASGRAVSTAPATCSRCGYEQHLSGERCPAEDATCHNEQKRSLQL